MDTLKSFHTGNYGGDLRRAILSLKLAGDNSIAEPLANRLAKKIKDTGELRAGELIVPVPHVQQVSAVGRIAKQLSKLADIPLSPDTLYLAKDIKQQAALKRKERFENVTGAFKAKTNGLAGKVVILVDDIYTTGATAAECSKALMEAGAKDVLVLTVAKTRYTPKEVKNMANIFVGKLQRKKNDDGSEWFSGYFGQVPLKANWRKSDPDCLDISIDAKSVAWKAEQPIPEKNDQPEESKSE